MSEPIVTDCQQQQNTLAKGFQSYRVLNYMVDVVKNAVSDIVNFDDTRIASLFNAAGVTADTIGSKITVAPIYREDMRDSGTTPAIRLSLGALTASQMHVQNVLPVKTPTGWVPAGERCVAFSGALQIATITEHYQATLLFTDMLAEYFITNAINIAHDCGMLDMLQVSQLSEVQPIQAGQDGRDRTYFQRVIGAELTGNLRYTVDTQGPVFRGVRTTLTVK